MPCYCCDPANLDRISALDPSAAIMRFPARFEGPPGAVNGGMAAGALGCPALEAAIRHGVSRAAVSRITARLHRGIPHSRDLRVEVSEVDGAYQVDVRDGDDVCIGGRVEVISRDQPLSAGDALARVPADLDSLVREMNAVAAPDAPPFFEETGDHPISGCFSCGPRNAVGLHIFPRFAGAGVTWANWSPESSFVDADGGLASSIVASALDCSSGICLPREEQEELLRTDQFYLLGSFDVRYLRVPPVDREYHVVGRARHREGRKFFGLSALFDDTGAVYAVAEATWIIVAMTRTQAFGSR